MEAVGADPKQSEWEAGVQANPQLDEIEVADEDDGEQPDYLISVGRKEPKDSSETLEEQIL